MESPVQRPLTPGELRRARQLVVTRRRATGLLVAVAVVFAISTALVGRVHWLTWVQATAVASLVGGLADWFAVTALFRRPLGLPIPHTAIVVERKDRFAETLGTFVQESFLSPEAVIARLHAAGALPRAAAWLSDPRHAHRLAAEASSAIVAATDFLGDADAQEILDGLVRQRIQRVALAPVAGRALESITRDSRHEPLVDELLRSLARYLRTNGPELHTRLGMQSPWWLPGTVSARMVNRLLVRTETVVGDMAYDRCHPLRLQLSKGLSELARRLQTDPELRMRGEQIKEDFLAQPTVRSLAASVWADVKEGLRAQAADENSDLRRRLERAITGTGERLSNDSELSQAANRALEGAVRTVLTNFAGELVELVTGTIARWDATDTSRRLELLLGPDLQYIRINGTVVGALAGLVLHAVSLAGG